MSTVARGCVLAAGFAFGATAFAQSGIGHIVFEVSADEQQTWSSRVDVAPGAHVVVRVRMQLLDASTGIVGFGGCTYQPTLSNWYPENGDEVDIDGWTGEIPPYTPYFYGRVFPFGGIGGSPPPTGALTRLNDIGHLLRIYQLGLSPFFGPAVNSAQLTRQLGGTNFVGGTDVVVMRYGFTLGDTGQERTLVTGVPLPPDQNSRMTWFTTENGSNSFFYTLASADIINAEINVIPAPRVLALLLTLSITPRRRRSNP
jgi:hypothetical protein